MTTQLELWREACEQLTRAVDELDQAHSTLRQIGMAQISALGFLKPNIRELYSDAESLLSVIKGFTCDDCAKPLAECECPEWREEKSTA